MNNLPQRQKFSGAAGTSTSKSVTSIKEPPDRAFLEKHIEEDRFLEFVSTRSPVFKTRPLPQSKKEAIDLMMEQPNLIKRPILVRGSKAIFGFDKEQYK